MTLRWGRVGLTAAGLFAALWIGSCTLNPQPEPPGDKVGGYDNGPASSGATGAGGSASTGSPGAGGSSVMMNPGGAAGAGPNAATDAASNAGDAGVAAAVDASSVDASSVDASSVDASSVDAKGDAGAPDAMRDGSTDVVPDAVDGSGD